MLKRQFLLGLALACLQCGSIPASAQVISLWADSNMYAHNVYPGMGGTFDMYIFVEPDQRGMFGVEFSIVYPSAAIFIMPPGTPVWNPAANVTVSMGSIFGDGISLGFGSCINTTTWIAMYNFISYEMNPVYFEIDVATTGLELVRCQYRSCATNFKIRGGYESYYRLCRIQPECHAMG
jgi:hypothetical protein